MAKAIANPDQLTTLEKQTLLQKADPTTQATNALKITGLTPEELENKALTSSEAMTYDEARLVQDGYHIWDTAEREANRTLSWPYEDFIAHITASVQFKHPMRGLLWQQLVVERVTCLPQGIWGSWRSITKTSRAVCLANGYGILSIPLCHE
jgi:hypothetical protein